MEETTFAYLYFSYVIDTARRPKLHQNRRSAGHVPFPLDADFRIYSPLGCTKNAAKNGALKTGLHLRSRQASDRQRRRLAGFSDLDVIVANKELRRALIG